jgi:hypothetical protein
MTDSSHGEGECHDQGLYYHDSLVVIPIVTSDMSRVICQSGSKQSLTSMRTFSDANASL